MNLEEKYGPTALVAGASEGIGAAFATFLASSGIDLVLVARRKEPLEILASALESQYKIKASCITCDLSSAGSHDLITRELDSRDINILVYNAALSFIGPFLDNSSEENNRAATVNMISPLNLVSFFGRKMMARGKGAVILMSSMAGFQGSGFLSVYAATKAFNRILAESLWYEWKNTGVDIIGCCAGATSTPGYIRSRPEKTGLFSPRVLSPSEIPAECFMKLGRQPSFITGRSNKIASFIMQKILPRRMAVNIMGDTTRKMYRL